MTNNMMAAKWIVSQVMRGTVRLMGSRFYKNNSFGLHLL